MKKGVRLISLILFIIVLFIVALYAVNYNIRINNRIQGIIQLADKYLYEKYFKNAIFEKKTFYYDGVYFINNVHFENEDIYFQVRYIPDSSHFEDDYIKNSIDFDLKNMIVNELNIMGIQYSSVFIGSLCGIRGENSEKFYDRFSSLKVIPTFNDYRDIINYDCITIYNDNIGFSNIEKEKIMTFLSELNLSVEKVEFKIEQEVIGK